VVERAFIVPPASRIGPITPEERKRIMAGAALAGRYEKTIDRESAYEKLKGRTTELQAEAPSKGKAAPAETSSGGGLSDILFGSTGPRGGKREGVLESAAKSAARTIGSQVGREIIRGVLGSILGGKRR
jgi:hypothetical protein